MRTRRFVLAALAVGVVASGLVAFRGVLRPLGELLGVGSDAEPSTCNLCGQTRRFRSAGVKPRPGAVCPVCQSKERHRLLFHYLEHSTSLLRDELDVLHFAPNPGLERALRAHSNLNYVTADLFAPADLKLDLTKIDQPDASWDVIICYHVLEHVLEDEKAMREMWRVLRPGGQAILQVPLEPDRTATYEDPTIVEPAARLEHFGQSDHVRRYGVADFARRLDAAGFEVEAVDPAASLDPQVVERHRLLGRFETARDQRIWIARKPAAP